MRQGIPWRRQARLVTGPKKRMTTDRNTDHGFALLTVLWVLIIVSAIAMSLTAAARLGTRIALAEQDAVVAERLAAAGLEMVDYLQTRGLGSRAENLTGLPISVIETGSQYRIDLPEGTIDLYFESDNGKIDPSNASIALLERFFANWTGDPRHGSRIAQAIADWRDADDQERLEGAESFFYASEGYSPRNNALGVADLALIRWFEPMDFVPRVIDRATGSDISEGLSAHLIHVPIEDVRINPNFASRQVLAALPDIGIQNADRIADERRRGFFRNAADLTARVALRPGFDPNSSMIFDRDDAPAILAVGTAARSGVRRSLRKAYRTDVFRNPRSRRRERRTTLIAVERNSFPDFIEGRGELTTAINRR